MQVAPTTPVTNEAGAVLEANGGTLALLGTFNNSGLIEGLNGSAVHIDGARINGGTLGGQVTNTGASGAATVNAVTIAPTGTLTGQNGTTTTLMGTITNNGTIAEASTGGQTDFILSGNVALNGTGTFQLSNSGNNRIYGNGGDNLTIGPQQTLQGAGQLGVNSGGLRLLSTTKARSSPISRPD